MPPTIGRADINVNYDGKDLPRQARAIGERAGDGAGEGFAEEFDKAAKTGFDDTAEDIEKSSGESGTRSGRNFGIKYGDSVDKVLRQRLRRTADEVAKVFTDDDGIKNFVENYKGAGNATDVLRGKLDDLHRSNVISLNDYDESNRKIVGYNHSVSDLNEGVQDLDRTTGGTNERFESFRRQMQGAGSDADDTRRRIVLLTGQSVNLSTGVVTTRDAVDDLGDSLRHSADDADHSRIGFDGLGDSIDSLYQGAQDGAEPLRNLGDAARDSGDDADRGSGGFANLGEAINDLYQDNPGGGAEPLRNLGDAARNLGEDSDDAAPRIRRGSGALDDLRDLIDRIKRDNPDADLDNLGRAVDRFGNYAETGGRRSGNGAPGFRDMRTELDRLNGVRGADIDLLARAINGFGNDADLAGRRSDGASRGVNSLAGSFRSLGRFDPADNMGQLFALIIVLAPQVAVLAAAAGAGLVVLAGGVGALALALGGGFIGFSNLFGDLKKVQPEVRPAAKALQDFAGPDGLGLLRDALQKPMFEGLAAEFDGIRTKTIPALEPAFEKLGGAINTVLTGWTTDLQSSGFKRDFDDLITSLNPSVEGLGKLFSNLVGTVQETLKQVAPYTADFIKGLNSSAEKFLAFLKTPEGHREFQQFFDDMTGVLGHVGDAFSTVGGAFKKLITKENIQRTIDALDDLADSVSSLVGAGDDLNGAVPVITEAIKQISGVLKKATDASAKADAKAFGEDWVDNLADGIQINYLQVDHALDLIIIGFSGFFKHLGEYIGTQVGNIGTLLGDLTNPAKFANIPGDLERMRSAIAKGFDNIKGDLDAVGGDLSAFYNDLPTKTQGALSKMSSNLGITGRDAKTFGGEIYSMAGSVGVDIETLDGKNLNGIIKMLGLTGGNAETFRKEWASKMNDAGIKVGDLDKASQASLNTISTNLGDTGRKSTAFQQVVAKSADDAGISLSDLAKTNSLGDLETKLGVAGRASKTEFANKIITAANDSGESLDDLPPKIQALVSKYGTIPASKDTKVTQHGAEGAKDKVDDLIGSVNRLSGKQIDIIYNEVYKSTGSGQIAKNAAQFANRVGGVMAGGMQIAGGEPGWGKYAEKVAYAVGGIVRRPTVFGNVLAGEAGAEAIVPLTGPLSRVDASVRELSAYARGQGVRHAGAAGNGRVVNVGGVSLHSNIVDPRQAVNAMFDRLDIAVGSL